MKFEIQNDGKSEIYFGQETIKDFSPDETIIVEMWNNGGANIYKKGQEEPTNRSPGPTYINISGERIPDKEEDKATRFKLTNTGDTKIKIEKNSDLDRKEVTIESHSKISGELKEGKWHINKSEVTTIFGNADNFKVTWVRGPLETVAWGRTKTSI